MCSGILICDAFTFPAAATSSPTAAAAAATTEG